MHSDARGGMAALWAAVLLWGSTGFLFAVVVWDLGTANFVRGLGATMMYLLLKRSVPWRIGWVQGIGAFGCGGASVFFTISMRESNPAAAAVWMYTAPIYTAAFDRIVRKQALPAKFWIALPVAIIGVALITWKDFAAATLWGHLAGLAGGVCFAIFGICRGHGAGSDGKLADGDKMQGMLFWGFLGTVIVCAPFFVMAIAENRVKPDLGSLGGCLSYGAITAICYRLVMRATNTVAPTTALIILTAEVPLIPLGASLVTGILPDANTIIGGVLVLAVSIGLSYSAAPRQAEP